MMLTFASVSLFCSASNRSTPTPARHVIPTKRPYGYWKDDENLVRELRQFANEQGDAMRMPTQAELMSAGRADLVGATRRRGTWPIVAKTAGLTPTAIMRPRSVYLAFCTKISGARPHNYWRDFNNLRAELEPFTLGGRLPNAMQLQRAQRSDLIRAIGRHGGFPVVSARLQLRSRYRPSKYWLQFENVARELRDFIDVHGAEGVMPPLSILRNGAPQGLLTAIQYKHGGCTEVARRMGLKCEHPRRPHRYWQLKENRLRETRAFVDELHTINPTREHDRMPTYAEFMRYGRKDLAAGLLRHEGLTKMGQLLGLRTYRGKRIAVM